MTITLDVDTRERAACDEMRRILGLSSDQALLRAALYKLAAWCEPEIDTTLFRQFTERQFLEAFGPRQRIQ